ncbi:TetR/AcrR family transcriptional regulator [Raineyella fluvialis]|uniref:TetR family transcriptional regulator n=1 Tax=Raineyella fluvialis TaxID=2662261 RepID=A0A5Q2FB61_9ACTN|nr:TetR/AcrR family transcriptional regulator [Raineyella fluvialis]QGF22957.1 TetR family transcriptional regulator [Raineyella fluvialis]
MGVRDEARAETMARIMAAAREQIATVGGAGLSMRAVAREVGLVSSAVYRYFPTRDALLTALIIESYERLGAHLAALPPRWRERAAGFRDWARKHPFEFQLIYGTPIPDYRAPEETIPAAATAIAPFLALADVADAVPELAQLVGFIGLELAGHFVGSEPPAEELFDRTLERQMATLGSR